MSDRNGSGDNGDGSVHPFPEPRERIDRNIPNLHAPDEPIDLAAVQADDELIDALAAGRDLPSGRPYHADDQVVALLSAWRAGVVAEPIPELLDIDAAVAAVRTPPRTARRPPSAKARHLAPAAAAAAFLVLVGGGVSLGSATAQPDSVLWPVSEMLLPARAASVQAAVRVSTKIESAKQALNEGEPAVAAAELSQARADLSAVRPQEGQAQLDDVQNFLVAKAAETPSGTSVDPASPLKTDRSRPIPAGAALAQQPTATGTVSPTPSSDLPTTAPPRSSHGSGSHSTSTPATTTSSTTSGRPSLTDSVGATPPSPTTPASVTVEPTTLPATSGLGATRTVRTPKPS